MASQSTRGPDTDVRIRGFYERAVAAGETLFDEGDKGDQLFVIQSGEVELTRETATGQRVVARLGPGDFFGELGVILGKARTTSAVAVNEVHVLALDRDTLESMCLDSPEIAIRLIRVLVSRLIEAERRLAALGADDLHRQLVRVLVRMGETGEDGSLRVPTTLRALAEEAGMTLRETHRVLHQLFDQRCLRLVDDVLIAPSVDALHASLDAE